MDSTMESLEKYMANRWTVTVRPLGITGLVTHLMPDRVRLHVLETDEDFDVRIDSIGELW